MLRAMCADTFREWRHRKASQPGRSRCLRVRRDSRSRQESLRLMEFLSSLFGGRAAAGSDLCPVVGALFHVRIRTFHPTLGPMQRDATKSFVYSMRVLSRQDPTAKSLQPWMSDDDLHQPLRQTAAAIFR